MHRNRDEKSVARHPFVGMLRDDAPGGVRDGPFSERGCRGGQERIQGGRGVGGRQWRRVNLKVDLLVLAEAELNGIDATPLVHH